MSINSISLRIDIIILLCSAFVAADRCHGTDDWTQFRGSHNSGIADPSAKPPVEWDLEQDVLWQTEIPGEGWSSPVFDSRGLIWFTTAITVAASPEEIEKKLAGDPMAKSKLLPARWSCWRSALTSTAVKSCTRSAWPRSTIQMSSIP